MYFLIASTFLLYGTVKAHLKGVKTLQEKCATIVALRVSGGGSQLFSSLGQFLFFLVGDNFTACLDAIATYMPVW